MRAYAETLREITSPNCVVRIAQDLPVDLQHETLLMVGTVAEMDDENAEVGIKVSSK